MCKMTTKEEKQVVLENLRTLPPNWRLASLSGKNISRDRAIREVEGDTETGKLIMKSYMEMLRKI